MNSESRSSVDRRQFIRAASAGGAAMTAMHVPHVFGQTPSDEIQIALIGCGGRGTGAANDALKVANAKLKLVALADIRADHVKRSLKALKNENEETPEQIDVPEERQFVGFDSYKNAMDALNPGDIAIFATPLAFRWVHFQYAIDRGLNVFMEKPLTADGPTSKRMLELSAKADEKNLKCGVGLMVRHCRGRQELHQRIQDGEIGDIVMMRAYRMHGPIASAFSERKPEGELETMWQLERFHSFLWASGGCFSDFYIHQIDETSWMKNDWPIKAQALGGRHYRGEYVDQNFDTYAVEYTYPDGSKLFFDGRCMPGCTNNMSSAVHGSSGSAIVSTSGHTPGKVKIFDGQKQGRRDIKWAYPQPETSPYRLEWIDLVDAIINNKPYNEVPRGVQASLVTSMGRMAAHTGREVTIDQMRNSTHEFAPGVADLTPEGLAPLIPDENGRYPVPMPGVNQDVEYQT